MGFSDLYQQRSLTSQDALRVGGVRYYGQHNKNCVSLLVSKNRRQKLIKPVVPERLSPPVFVLKVYCVCIFIRIVYNMILVFFRLMVRPKVAHAREKISIIDCLSTPGWVTRSAAKFRSGFDFTLKWVWSNTLPLVLNKCRRKCVSLGKSTEKYMKKKV